MGPLLVGLSSLVVNLPISNAVAESRVHSTALLLATCVGYSWSWGHGPHINPWAFPSPGSHQWWQAAGGLGLGCLALIMVFGQRSKSSMEHPPILAPTTTNWWSQLIVVGPLLWNPCLVIVRDLSDIKGYLRLLVGWMVTVLIPSKMGSDGRRAYDTVVPQVSAAEEHEAGATPIKGSSGCCPCHRSADVGEVIICFLQSQSCADAAPAAWHHSRAWPSQWSRYAASLAERLCAPWRLVALSRTLALCWPSQELPKCKFAGPPSQLSSYWSSSTSSAKNWDSICCLLRLPLLDSDPSPMFGGEHEDLYWSRSLLAWISCCTVSHFYLRARFERMFGYPPGRCLNSGTLQYCRG